MTNREKRDAALLYASLDVPVVPCDGKAAVLSYADATTDRAQIKKWWRDWPNANVGISTVSGLVFLDMDPRHGGKDGLRQLVAKIGPLPATVESISGRNDGGGHRYFLSNGTPLKNGLVAPGVELKANGYVLAPPSVHPDTLKPYSWRFAIEDYEIAELPAEVADLAFASTSHATVDWEPLDVEAIFEGVPVGERDNKAYRYACSLRSRDVPKREALALMKLAWERMEQHGRDEFPLQTALEKVHRIYKTYPAGKSPEFDPKPASLVVRTADLSQAKPISWVWHHRVPMGYLSLLLGAEGIGKGTFIAWMIAKLTTGDLPGDLRGEPIRVAIVGDEDSFSDVWTPRLHVAGADLSRVHAIERPDLGYIDLKNDLPRLETLVEEWDFALIYLDQILDNLGPKVDDWRGKQVREALRPARLLARDRDLAVLAAMHPNKRGSTFRELVSGATAFNAVSRSSLFLTSHREDPDRRVLVRGKGNLSPAPSSVEFDIAEKRFKHGEHVFTPPVVTDLVHGDLTVDDLVGEAEGSAGKVGDARRLIEQMLPNDGEWHPAAPIIEAAQAQDIGYKTVYRASHKVGVERARKDEFQGAAVWRWPRIKITVRRRESDSDDA